MCLCLNYIVFMLLTHWIETNLKESGITSIINDRISMKFPHVIILANTFILIVSKKKKKNDWRISQALKSCWTWAWKSKWKWHYSSGYQSECHVTTWCLRMCFWVLSNQQLLLFFNLIAQIKNASHENFKSCSFFF